MSHKKRGEHLMKCSPLFLTSPTVVWKESFRYMKFLDVLQTKFQSLNPLSGKESFRLDLTFTIKAWTEAS